MQEQRETDDALQDVFERQPLRQRAFAFAAAGGDRLVAALPEFLGDGLDHGLLLLGEFVPKLFVEVVPQPGRVVFLQPVAAAAVGAGRNEDDFARRPLSRLRPASLSRSVSLTGSLFLPFPVLSASGFMGKYGRTDYR